MESSEALALNRFFSQATLRQLAEEGASEAYLEAVARCVPGGAGKTHRECVRELYRCLESGYRNEYFYKNTLLNKLLLGTHSLRTATALSELPVGRSKADFVLINGRGVVYEIKTGMDNLERLGGQLRDYYKAFSYVVVVASESHLGALQRRLGNSPVGICVLNKRSQLSVRKAPQEDGGGLDKTEMFKMLRKAEFEQILKRRFGALPDVSQFRYWRECKNMFESLPVGAAQAELLRVLKRRAMVDCGGFAKVPYEMRFLVYFSETRKEGWARMMDFLAS